MTTSWPAASLKDSTAVSYLQNDRAQSPRRFIIKAGTLLPLTFMAACKIELARNWFSYFWTIVIAVG